MTAALTTTCLIGTVLYTRPGILPWTSYRHGESSVIDFKPEIVPKIVSNALAHTSPSTTEPPANGEFKQLSHSVYAVVTIRMQALGLSGLPRIFKQTQNVLNEIHKSATSFPSASVSLLPRKMQEVNARLLQEFRDFMTGNEVLCWLAGAVVVILILRYWKHHYRRSIHAHNQAAGVSITETHAPLEAEKALKPEPAALTQTNQEQFPQMKTQEEGTTAKYRHTDISRKAQTAQRSANQTTTDTVAKLEEVTEFESQCDVQREEIDETAKEERRNLEENVLAKGQEDVTEVGDERSKRPEEDQIECFLSHSEPLAIGAQDFNMTALLTGSVERDQIFEKPGTDVRSQHDDAPQADNGSPCVQSLKNSPQLTKQITSDTSPIHHHEPEDDHDGTEGKESIFAGEVEDQGKDGASAESSDNSTEPTPIRERRNHLDVSDGESDSRVSNAESISWFGHQRSGQKFDCEDTKIDIGTASELYEFNNDSEDVTADDTTGELSSTVYSDITEHDASCVPQAIVQNDGTTTAVHMEPAFRPCAAEFVPAPRHKERNMECSSSMSSESGSFTPSVASALAHRPSMTDLLSGTSEQSTNQMSTGNLEVCQNRSQDSPQKL